MTLEKDSIHYRLLEIKCNNIITTNYDFLLEKAYIGETIEVLIEGKDALKNMYIGRSKACAPDEVDGVIYVNSNKDIPMGSFVNVTITDALAYDLIGTAV